MKKVTVVLALVMIFCLIISGAAFARGNYRGGGHHGGHHTGGFYGPGAVLGGIAAGAFLGYLAAPRYVPTCYDRVVRPAYYTYDYYGRSIWNPPVVERVCY